MARKKVKLAYISDNAARKISYQKRKKSITKLMSELSTLCGIPVCAIISSPFDSEPEIWPDLQTTKQLIERYQNAPLLDINKNVTHESFIEYMIFKARDKLNKLDQQNREKELTMTILNSMQDNTLLEGMTIKDANDINTQIEKMKMEIDIMIAALN